MSDEELKENGGAAAITDEVPSGKSAPDLRRLAFTDELTGLKNSRFLKYRAPAYINAAKKAGAPLCMAMMDMDGFKNVNDTYGHKAGDTLLANFGKMVAEHIGKAGVPIRYAGDEFAALLFNMDKSKSLDFMNEFLEKLSGKPIDIGDGNELPIRISVGLAGYPNDAQEYETLFKRADEALYAAKESGKGRVIAYPDEGKLVALGNISTLFPVEDMIGFEGVFADLKLNTIDRAVGDRAQPELPIVVGPRGAGKTRVLTELKKEAETRGIEAVYLTGMPTQNRPYDVMVKAFADVFRTHPEYLSEIGGSLNAQEREILMPDIPGLTELEETDERAPANDTPETTTFKALNKILFGLLREGRLLMIVDDAHIVDKATLRFIDSFVSEFPNSKLDLAFAITTEEDVGETSESNLTQLMGNLSKAANKAEIHRMEMTPLDVTDIAHFIYQITGHIDIPPEVLRALLDRTNGNPLFIEETLKVCIERELISYDGASWNIKSFGADQLPESIEDAVSERAAQLPERDKEILQKAAIMGENFDVKVLARLIDTDEQEILDVLEEARKAHIIQEDLTGKSDYSFNSVAGRNAFYYQIDENDRKKLHFNVAELEKEVNKDRLDEVLGKLAYHFQQAERYDKAVEILSQTADREVKAQIPDAIRRMLQRKIYVDDMTRKRQLTDEEIEKAIKGLRECRIAIQAIKFYPPENANVRKSVRKSFREIEYLLTLVPALSFTAYPKTILVNGQQPDPKKIDNNFVNYTHDLFDNYGLHGIIFMEGLTLEELTRFFEIFAMKREEVVDHWDELIKEKDLVHVKPDMTIYVAVGDKTSDLKGKSLSVGEGDGEMGDNEATLKVMKKIEELLDEFRGESTKFLNKLEKTGDTRDPGLRQLVKLLDELGGFVPEEMRSQPLQEKGSREVLRGERDTAPESSDESEPKPEKVDRKDDPMYRWILQIKSPDRVVKAKAVQNLVNTCGEEAIEPCLQAILEEDEKRVKQLLAVIISRIGKAGREKFAEFFNRDLPPEDLLSLCSVAVIFKDQEGVPERLLELLKSPFDDVKTAAFEALDDFPQEVKSQAVMEGLQSENHEIRVAALSKIGEIGNRDMIPDLIDDIDRKNVNNRLPDTSITIAAIRSLGDLKSAAAVDHLIKLAQSGGWFTKTMPDDIRVAAIKALGKIGERKGLKALKKLKKDKVETVKKVASEILGAEEE